MALTYEQIAKILESGDFESFIEETETHILECKREPYRLDHDRGSMELAKDVASFANAGGGYLVIGLETQRTENTMFDVIRRLRPLKQDQIDTKQYQDILGSWLVPPPTVFIKWYPSRNDSQRGLFAIKIPEQTDSQPFLTARLLDTNEKRVEVAFGYAERREARSEPISVHEMQGYFRDGKRFSQQIARRFDLFEAKLKKPSLAVDFASQLGTAIDAALDAAALRERRVITLVAHPNQQVELRTIFDPSAGSLLAHLQSPPYTRYSGWHLGASHTAKIVRGELARVTRDDFVIDLYRNGMLVFPASAESDYYCWGLPYPRLNDLALAEATYNFVAFYQLVVQDMGGEVIESTLTIDARNLHKDGVKNFIAPDRGRSFDAPHDSWQKSLVLTHPEIANTGRAAYQLIREFYLWCGADESLIPYTRKERELKIIDPSLFPRN